MRKTTRLVLILGGLFVAYYFINVQQSKEPKTIPEATEATKVSQYISRYGGKQDVYERILSMRDCATLQEQFDLASENNQRAKAGTAQFKWTLGYMTATDDRMKAVGCYK